MSSYYTDLDNDREEYFESEDYIVIDKMQRLYSQARSAKVNSTIKCPCCQKSIVKTTYHKVFCSNARTKGRKNCKDRYWNTVDESRAKRARRFS